METSEVEESVWCEVRLRNNDKLLVGCIYRSPNSGHENNTQLNKLIVEVAKIQTYTHLLIGGDLNYPGIDWQSEVT